MDKKTKIFLIIFSTIILISIILTIYRVFVVKDYQVETEVSCDPLIEKCFILQSESEEETYYKIINKNVGQIPPCDSNKEECAELSCLEGEKDCNYTYCDPNSISGDEKCVDTQNIGQ